MEKIILPEEIVVSPGESVQVEVSTVPSDIVCEFTYGTDNEEIAYVSDVGILYGCMEGSTTLKVSEKNNGLSAECPVLVALVPLEDISLEKTSLDMALGDEDELTVLYTPENASVKDIVWESSDVATVFVDNAGRIRAEALGSAEITATSVDGGFSAVCKVSVNDTTDIYAAGFENDMMGGSGRGFATIWKNGERLYRLNEPTWVSVADAVYVTDDGDVYASWYELRQEGTNIAYISRNGEKLYQLNEEGILGYAPALQVVGDDVYAVGCTQYAYGNSKGFVWKNGEVLYEFGDFSNIVWISDILVVGTDVYCVGYERIPNNENLVIEKARLWKNGEPYGTLEGVGESMHSEANGITMTNDGSICVSGIYVRPDDGAILGVTWIDGKMHVISGMTSCYKTEFDSEGNPHSVGIGELGRGGYSAGWSHVVNFNPDVWDNYMDVAVDGGDNVYIGGAMDETLNVGHARIWRNGRLLYTMLSDDMIYSNVYSLFIVK